LKSASSNAGLFEPATINAAASALGAAQPRFRVSIRLSQPRIVIAAIA
jgi:hypothetical protein